MIRCRIYREFFTRYGRQSLRLERSNPLLDLCWRGCLLQLFFQRWQRPLRRWGGSALCCGDCFCAALS